MLLRSRLLVPLIVLFAWLLPAPVRAQVNAEVLRPNPFREGWSGGVDASVAVTRGNVEVFDLGGAGRVQYQTLHPRADAGLPWLHQRVFLAANGRFAERAGEAFVNQAFAHLRWTALWHRRIGSEVFAQVQLNEFQRLQARAVTGLGARVELVHTPALLLWAGSGYMLEYNRIDVLPGAPDAAETLEHRWTNYLSARVAALRGQLLLQSVLFVQPRFDAFGDVRVLEELEVLAKVGELFGLGATASLLFDADPPTGVRDTDLRLVTMVRLSF